MTAETYSVSYWVADGRYWRFAGEGSRAWADERADYLRNTGHNVRVRKVK